MSRLGIFRTLQLQRIRINELLIARPTCSGRYYARHAPRSRRSKVEGVEGLEGLEDIEGIERLVNLKELGERDPDEAAMRLKQVEGLSGEQILKKLGELEEQENKIASSFQGVGDDNFAFPDLMTPDPLMDTHEAIDFPPTKDSPYPARIIIRNDDSLLQAEKERIAAETNDPQLLKELSPVDRNPDAEADEEESPLTYLPFKKGELANLYRFPLISRRVTQQTGKGKIHRMYSLIVVGNGDGLVGYGEGKDDDASRASDKAFAEAVRRMDYVERFEKRTIWTDMDTKLGATRIILRPRPVGFGLACNPNIHQVLKAAGIKDASAKVWGSRNPINVIKALFRMIHAGNAPLSMGDGIGGGARKLDKGSSVRGKDSVERERGRKLVDLRTW